MTPTIRKHELAAIKDFKARLLDRYPQNIVSFKLFGSKARGDVHSESDLDVLVIVKERTTDFDEAMIDVICDMLNEHDVYIETVTMTEASFQDALDMQMPFAINITRDAISI